MSWLKMLKQTISDWLEDKAPKLAASLAIYAMLSIAPMLVIITKIVGVVFRDEAASGKVAKFMQGVLPIKGAPEALQEVIRKAGEHGEGVTATVLAIGMAAFGATGVFGELQDSMNTIWEVKPKPNRGIWGFIRTRFLSFAMVLGIAFLLMVSTVGTALITTVGGWLTGGTENKIIALVVTTVASLAVMTLLFAMIFKLLPDANVRWKDVWVAAVGTALLFEVGKHFLGWYLESSTAVFGPASFLAGLLLWIYYSAQILFLGAEFTQVWANAHGHEIEPSKHAVKVTEEDRAQEGRASPERVAAAAREPDGKLPAGAGTRGGGGGRAGVFDVVRRPVVARPSNGNGDRGAKDYALAAGGAVVGAVLAGLGVEYFLHDPKKPTRKQAAAVRLNERIDRVEQKLGRVSRIKDYLEEMDVKDRIDRVEKEIHRAGRHVRAKETGRPLWMVRLGDLIGGRWSNL